MFIDPFLSLLAGYCLYSAWIHHELILHDNGNVSHSQLGLIRLNESQFDLIVLLQQFLMLPLPFQLLPLFLCEIHWQNDAFIFICNPNLLIKDFAIYLIPVNIIFNADAAERV